MDTYRWQRAIPLRFHSEFLFFYLLHGLDSSQTFFIREDRKSCGISMGTKLKGCLEIIFQKIQILNTEHLVYLNLFPAELLNEKEMRFLLLNYLCFYIKPPLKHTYAFILNYHFVLAVTWISYKGRKPVFLIVFSTVLNSHCFPGHESDKSLLRYTKFKYLHCFGIPEIQENTTQKKSLSH